ncbi:hypothetical protein UFOVP325_40 [uncultured Caudovirales phage]|uniref:Uncharacterized protein n=1 Tax=uncultured Caudovirales phage TaxID=2100421 RepID=A0A6J5MVA9_9CAUD|nr:hypothetical protein UFOVP325_40 [uncultured Caudovirales phage]CAB4147589.1 hypothetical protein UFOVP430_35 [uncultured Caudovirales phage]
MGKTYRVGIVAEYTPDENNYLHWEDEYEIEDEDKDEDFVPRPETQLITLLRNELWEIIHNGINRDELYSMITIEVIEEN